MSLNETDTDFNRRLIDTLANSALKEQRARRRWSIFFKLVILLYVITITILFYEGSQATKGLSGGGKAHTAIIQISGSISADNQNASSIVNQLLNNAFNNKNSKGIILEINSPGGSAVESHRIYREIRRLREKHPEKSVIAVVGDYCASGGYFIAAAADEIYADQASMLGSIGVIFSGFGFTGAMEKAGIERRVQTAGKNKALLDPFLPEREEDKEIITAILDDIHVIFAQAVREGRAERLADDARIFSGALFSGSDSLQLGLIDGFNDIGGVSRDIIGTEDFLYYRKDDWLDNVLSRLGGVLAPTAALTPVIH